MNRSPNFLVWRVASALVLVATVFALGLLAGCGKSEPVHVEVLTGTVVQEYENDSKWGCVGTDWNTVLRFDDGRVAQLCGRFGGVGAKVRGCYYTGHFDRSHDGFRLICRVNKEE